MPATNTFFNHIIDKKYDMANSNAKELLNNAPHVNAGEKTLDFATELNIGKLGKLMKNKE